jgi:hypothetical protein
MELLDVFGLRRSLWPATLATALLLALAIPAGFLVTTVGPPFSSSARRAMPRGLPARRRRR